MSWSICLSLLQLSNHRLGGACLHADLPAHNQLISPHVAALGGMFGCSAAQAAGVPQATEAVAAESGGGVARGKVEAGEEATEKGLMLGKRHQRMFKPSEDEFLLKYWVRYDTLSMSLQNFKYLACAT